MRHDKIGLRVERPLSAPPSRRHDQIRASSIHEQPGDLALEAVHLACTAAGVLAGRYTGELQNGRNVLSNLYMKTRGPTGCHGRCRPMQPQRADGQEEPLGRHGIAPWPFCTWIVLALGRLAPGQRCGATGGACTGATADHHRSPPRPQTTTRSPPTSRRSQLYDSDWSHRDDSICGLLSHA